MADCVALEFGPEGRVFAAQRPARDPCKAALRSQFQLGGETARVFIPEFDGGALIGKREVGRALVLVPEGGAGGEARHYVGAEAHTARLPFLVRRGGCVLNKTGL